MQGKDGKAGDATQGKAECGPAKIFVEPFSESLDAENAQRGVRVQCQVTVYVATKLPKLRKSLMIPTAEAYVGGRQWRNHGFFMQNRIVTCLDLILFTRSKKGGWRSK